MLVPSIPEQQQHSKQQSECSTSLGSSEGEGGGGPAASRQQQQSAVSAKESGVPSTSNMSMLYLLARCCDWEGVSEEVRRICTNLGTHLFLPNSSFKLVCRSSCSGRSADMVLVKAAVLSILGCSIMLNTLAYYR
jgi:hypothetical protein